MLGKKPLLCVSLDVDHGQSTQHLILCNYPLVNDRRNHVCSTLNQPVVKRLDIFSFAMPHNRSTLSDHRPAVPVTGVLNCKKPLRLRTVQSVFHYLPGLNVIWTPIHSGSDLDANKFGICFCLLSQGHSAQNDLDLDGRLIASGRVRRVYGWRRLWVRRELLPLSIWTGMGHDCHALQTLSSQNSQEFPFSFAAEPEFYTDVAH